MSDQASNASSSTRVLSWDQDLSNFGPTETIGWLAYSLRWTERRIKSSPPDHELQSIDADMERFHNKLKSARPEPISTISRILSPRLWRSSKNSKSSKETATLPLSEEERQELANLQLRFQTWGRETFPQASTPSVSSPALSRQATMRSVPTSPFSPPATVERRVTKESFTGPRPGPSSQAQTQSTSATRDGRESDRRDWI